MSAHMLQGGPLAGVVVKLSPRQPNPEQLRILPTQPGLETIIIHVYSLNRGHSAGPQRPARPTYHYSHTVTI